MALSPNKWLKIHTRMSRLNISESEIEEQFIQGSGSGGQKINKTSSCVLLKHLPTRTVIKCQRSRSRELNRYYARQELCDKIANEKEAIQQNKRAAAAKKRRENRLPSQSEKKKRKEQKQKRSEKKRLRQRPEI